LPARTTATDEVFLQVILSDAEFLQASGERIFVWQGHGCESSTTLRDWHERFDEPEAAHYERE
jgi:hypothetical protein